MQVKKAVLVHGFSQNRLCWGPLGELLKNKMGDGFEAALIDAPGHGEQPHSGISNLQEAGQNLVERGLEAHYVGYSMGGRMLLSAAVDQSETPESQRMPNAIQSLVLIGATAGIESPKQRSTRQALDAQRGKEIEQRGLQAFLTDWLQQPFFADLSEDTRFLSERMQNDPAGLVQSLQRCGTGSQPSLWPKLKQIDIPVLILAGQHDKKYCDIGAKLAQAIGENARFESIQGAHHALHLTNPHSTTELITSFWTQPSVGPPRN